MGTLSVRPSVLLGLTLRKVVSIARVRARVVALGAWRVPRTSLETPPHTPTLTLTPGGPSHATAHAHTQPSRRFRNGGVKVKQRA